MLIDALIVSNVITYCQMCEYLHVMYQILRFFTLHAQINILYANMSIYFNKSELEMLFFTIGR